MKKITILAMNLCLLPVFLTISEAGIITTEIYIDTIVNDDLGIDLEIGDTIGTFFFDNSTPFVDRDASDYGGLPEGIPTDTFVNYDPISGYYDGSLEAYWDGGYYDVSFSESKLPFQFNLELHSSVMTFNIEGIMFDTSLNFLSLDHSRRIFGDGRDGYMNSNRVIMGNNFENYIFEYKIRYPVPANSTPIPEPNTMLLLFMGLSLIAYQNKNQVKGS